MKPTFFLLAWGLAAAWPAGAATADIPHGSRDEARAMVRKAVTHYQRVGQAQAWADFTQPGGAFTERDLYVYVMDMDGRNTAHGANARLVGRDLVPIRDVDGKPFVAEILDKARAGHAGWTDYKWTHPLTKDIGATSAYCEAYDAHVFCVGAYR